MNPLYEVRQTILNRRYEVDCRDLGISPEVSYRAIPQEFAGDGVLVERAFENGNLVPVVPPDCGDEKLTETAIVLRIQASAYEWCGYERGKWIAYFVVMGQERRSLREVTETEKIPLRTLQRRVEEARIWKSELISELTGKDL